MSYPKNSPDSSVDDGQLRAFVERIERVQTEIDDRNRDKSEIFSEAKSAGYDVKVLKSLIAERRKDPDALAEFETVLDLYRVAVSGGSR